MKVSEAQEQTTVMNWARWNESRHEELALLHHIPNGGSRNKIEAANLKRQGVKAGVPDLCLPVPRQGYHGLYLEMKSERGRISSEQVKWINILRENGYAVFVCYGAKTAIEKIEWYLGGQDEKFI